MTRSTWLTKLAEQSDPQAVGQLVTDAILGAFDYPGTFAQEAGAVRLAAWAA
jgi:hypothetical protein